MFRISRMITLIISFFIGGNVCSADPNKDPCSDYKPNTFSYKICKKKLKGPSSVEYELVSGGWNLYILKSLQESRGSEWDLKINIPRRIEIKKEEGVKYIIASSGGDNPEYTKKMKYSDVVDLKQNVIQFETESYKPMFSIQRSGARLEYHFFGENIECGVYVEGNLVAYYYGEKSV